MLNLIKFKSLLIFWVLVVLAGCDSELAAVQSADTSQIDEVRNTNSKILDNRKARCDDLLSTLETNEMSKKIWNSLQCPTFYKALTDRDNLDVAVNLTVSEERVSTSVQSGEIDFGGAPQNISKSSNDTQIEGFTGDESRK